MTVWHVTFTTYGARVHGDERPTVDRYHNDYGTPYLEPDPQRELIAREAMTEARVLLTNEQRHFIESTIPRICARGGWVYIACAAAPDHIHVLLNAQPRLHGKQIRPWLKRWITEALDERWAVPKRPDESSWWTDGGSTRAVTNDVYFHEAKAYIERQRAAGM